MTSLGGPGDPSLPDVAVHRWPVRGTDLVFVDVSPADVAGQVTAVRTRVEPSAAVLVGDPDLRDALVTDGGTLVRHVHGMRTDLSVLPPRHEPDAMELRPWEPGDERALAPAFVAAYGPEHVDPRSPDLQLAERELAEDVTDPDNPLLADATRVAVVGGRPVGAVLVLDSRHLDGWTGPWVMNVFRDPATPAKGVGLALLTAAMHAVAAGGGGYLGLAVTDANPARRLYQRLGFVDGLEGWVVVLPPER